MKKIENRQVIIDLLKSGTFVPLNIVGILENTSNIGYFDDETGSVWVENDYFNYVYGDSKVILNKIEQLEDGFYGFSGVLGELAKSIYSEYLLHWLEPTERYIFTGDLKALGHQNTNKTYDVVSIPFEEAKGIDDRYEYQQEGSLKRIQDAILNRPTSAIYINNELASYVLVHEDNSIGYMFTLEKYRQEGLGYIVTMDILEKMIAKKTLPFVEINQRNFKSQRLAKKTSFEKDAFMPWFGIIKGCPEVFKDLKPFGEDAFYFTTMAQMIYGDCLTSRFSSIAFTKEGKDYFVQIEAPKKATFKIRLDESDEAYVVDFDELESPDYFEVLKAIGLNFPEDNASLVFRYREGIEHHFKGIKGNH